MGKVVDEPVVVRQGAGPQKTVEFPQLQFLDKGNMPVVVQRQVLGCRRPCDYAASRRRLWRGGGDEEFSPIFAAFFGLPREGLSPVLGWR